jgi:hypothetical protein
VLHGQVECAAAHEDRVRREVRDRLSDHKSSNLGHVASRLGRLPSTEFDPSNP